MNLKCLLFGHKYIIQNIKVGKIGIISFKCKRCRESPSPKIIKKFIKEFKSKC